ncbi:hypothetical protein [Luteolibacter sp. LG18]|uniref:hypothetical protein n=1 Tax=Luteolibacter sp. LG18 TaxID=2819286 RepID=UPI002B29910F|nr:hypothetical protein llg_07290 [Luteolibacter sp. LG18]BCU79642.1 hypothetical protein llg_43570 [Luteolibacter sp. LG18]
MDLTPHLLLAAALLQFRFCHVVEFGPRHVWLAIATYAACVVQIVFCIVVIFAPFLR